MNASPSLYLVDGVPHPIDPAKEQDFLKEAERRKNAGEISGFEKAFPVRGEEGGSVVRAVIPESKFLDFRKDAEARGFKYEVGGNTPQPRTWGEAVTDAGKGLKAGTSDAMSGIAQLVKLAGRSLQKESGPARAMRLMGRPISESEGRNSTIGNLLETIGNDAQAFYDPITERTRASMSPIGQNPQTFGQKLGGAVAQSIPSLAASAALAAPLAAAMPALGVGATASKLAKAGNLIYKGIPAAAGEGLVSGGSASAQLENLIRQSSPEQLQGKRSVTIADQVKDAFGNAREIDTPAAQKEAIAQIAAMDEFKRQTATTALINLLTGGGVLRRLIPAGGSKVAATADGLAKRIGKGALSEFVQETPQSGAEQAQSNLGAQRYVDPTQKIGTGVADAAVLGGAAGAILGGAAGGIEPSNSRKAATPQRAASAQLTSPVVPGTPPAPGVAPQAAQPTAPAAGVASVEAPPNYTEDQRRQQGELEAMRSRQVKQAPAPQEGQPQGEPQELTPTYQSNVRDAFNNVRVATTEEVEAGPSGKISRGITQAMGRVFGKEVVFVSGMSQNGTFVKVTPDKVYVDVKTEDNLTRTASHELLHSLQQETPDYYNEFLTKIVSDKKIRGEWQKYRDAEKSRLIKASKDAGALPEELAKLQADLDGMSEQQWQDEFAADFAGDQMTKPEFWKRMSDKTSPGLVQKIHAKLADLVTKITNAIPGIESKEMAQYFGTGKKRLEAARDALADTIIRYRNNPQHRAYINSRQDLRSREAMKTVPSPGVPLASPFADSPAMGKASAALTGSKNERDRVSGVYQSQIDKNIREGNTGLATVGAQPWPDNGQFPALDFIALDRNKMKKPTVVKNKDGEYDDIPEAALKDARFKTRLFGGTSSPGEVALAMFNTIGLGDGTTSAMWPIIQAEIDRALELKANPEFNKDGSPTSFPTQDEAQMAFDAGIEYVSGLLEKGDLPPIGTIYYHPDGNGNPTPVKDYEPKIGPTLEVEGISSILDVNGESVYVDYDEVSQYESRENVAGVSDETRAEGPDNVPFSRRGASVPGGEAGGRSNSDSPGSFSLESQTPEQVDSARADERKRAERQAMLDKQAAPIKARPVDTTGDLFDQSKSSAPLFAAPTPKANDPQKSYDAALARFKKASQSFDELTRKYRAKEIGDNEYLAGRKIFEAESALLDDAEKALGQSENPITPAKKGGSQQELQFSRKSITPERDQEYLSAVERGDTEAAQRMVDEKLSSVGAMWHGTASGDLRGGISGLHVGTKQAATEALEARIGIPADGQGWDGTREYGSTLLAGRRRIESGEFGKYRVTGHNVDAPMDDYYAKDHPKQATTGRMVPVDMAWKPWVRPVLITGEMAKRKKTDSAANFAMRKRLLAGTAKEGFYYINEGEDAGSISAVLPNGDSVRVKLPDPITRDDQGSVIPLSQRFNQQSDDIRNSRRPITRDDGLRNLGRPDLSQVSPDPATREEFRKVDVVRNVQGQPERETFKMWHDAADKRIEKGKASLWNKLQTGKINWADPVETVAAAKLITQYRIEATNEKDLAAVQLAIYNLRESRSDAARALASLRDPLESPEQRSLRILKESILEPSVQDMEKIKKAKSEAQVQELLAKNAAKIQSVLDQLAARGIDINNLAPADLRSPRKVAEIKRVVDTTRATLGDKLFEFWRNSILSALTTGVVNLSGNTLNLAYEYTAQRLAEAVIGSATGSKNVPTLGELKYVYQAALPGLVRGVRGAAEAFSTEQQVLEGTKLEKTRGPDTAISGAKGRIIRIPQRTLLATDELYKGMIHHMELTAEAYRTIKEQSPDLEGDALVNRMRDLVDNPTEAMKDEALERAKAIVFQAPPGKFVEGLMKMRSDFPAIRYILPFLQTPTNIYKTGLGRVAPIGTARMAYRWYRGDYAGNPNKMIRDVAENLLAWPFAMLIYSLVAGGDDDEPWITGSNTTLATKEERDMLQREYPPQSIRIGSRWYSYARLDPFATTIVPIVDTATALKNIKNGADWSREMKKLVGSMQSLVTDKTFMQGIGDIVSAMQGGQTAPERAAEWVSNFAASWMPNIAKSVMRATDPFVRDYKNREQKEQWLMKLGERTFQRAVPLEAFAPPPKRDWLGRPVEKTENFGPATDILYRIFSPGRLQSVDRNNFNRMVFNWNRTTDEENVWWPGLPDKRWTTARGTKIDLTDEKYDAYLKRSGDLFVESAERFKWNFDNPTQRDIDRMKDRLKAAREQARREIEKETR